MRIRRAWVMVAVAGLILGGTVPRASAAPSSDPGRAVVKWKAGDCTQFSYKQGTGLTDPSPAVPCSAPHSGEVYRVIDWPLSAQPDLYSFAALTQDLDAEVCDSTKSWNDHWSWGSMVVPTPDQWVAGDRQVRCIASIYGKVAPHITFKQWRGRLLTPREMMSTPLSTPTQPDFGFTVGSSPRWDWSIGRRFTTDSSSGSSGSTAGTSGPYKPPQLSSPVFEGCSVVSGGREWEVTVKVAGGSGWTPAGGTLKGNQWTVSGFTSNDTLIVDRLLVRDVKGLTHAVPLDPVINEYLPDSCVIFGM